jgi:hypothetical protein
MGLLDKLRGNVTEFSVEKAQKELEPILFEGEQVVKAFRLIRDQIVMTTHRIITVNKQGLTGSKTEIASIPYKRISKYSRKSAGLLDFDAELRIWIMGESEPVKWEFSKGVDINEAYRLLSYYVAAN